MFATRMIRAGMAALIGMYAAVELTTFALAAGPAELKVEGKHLTTVAGEPVHLHGVNVPSLEWSQGEHLMQTLDTVVDQWGANIIRLPLAQDRWFGRTKDKEDGGAHYRQTVQEFVTKAAAKNCYVILDLHWSDAGQAGKYVGQHKMPDAGSVEFWRDVAKAYANQPAVLFGLYNEPHDISWTVSRDGGAVTEDIKDAPGGKATYDTLGLQKLLDACREAGAKNVAVVGGTDWAYDLAPIAKYALTDPKGHGVMYDTHIYPWKKDWDKHLTSAMEKYPVLVGEFGPDKGDLKAFTTSVLDYIHKHDLQWTAWCLHPGAKPNLIKNWEYAPTAGFGDVVRDALQAEKGKSSKSLK